MKHPRSTAVLSATLLPPVEARAEEQGGVALITVGSRVRVLAPTVVPGKVDGTLAQIDGTFLLVSATDGGVVKLPRQAITKLEVSIGKHGHALKGLLIGGLIGGAVGVGAAGCGDCSSAGLHAAGAAEGRGARLSLSVRF